MVMSHFFITCIFSNLVAWYKLIHIKVSIYLIVKNIVQHIFDYIYRFNIYSVSPIYRGRVYRGIGYITVACWTPFICPPIWQILQTWRPRARYFSRNRGNSLHSIRGRHFFAKSAHRDSLCSCSLETIFRKINSSLPVNAGWNTCCAMGSHARRSIDTSIVLQSRV